MYHCNVEIYFCGCPDSLYKVAQQMPPLERFSHMFSGSDVSQLDMVGEADVIFLGIDRMDDAGYEELEKVISHKKKTADIFLLTGKEELSEPREDILYKVRDIWHTPLSEGGLRFHFLRWQQYFKDKTDLWLVSQYLNQTIDSVPNLIWYKDKAGSHEKVNAAFCNAVNKTMEQIQGRGHYYIWDLTPDEYAKGEYICMESEYEVMDKKETCIFDEQVKIGNEIRQLKTYKSPLFDIDGTVMGTVGVAMDVTQERLYEKMILNNANTDFLTGLYNRRYISDFIEKKKGEPLVVYYMDLDNFKHVNDRYGHEEGDTALKLTSSVLKECMPESTIARIGGDEFLAIELGNYSKNKIEEKRRSLQNRLNQAFMENDHLKIVSVSIGIAYSEDGKNSMDQLISEADALMYQEKNQKKGRIKRED
jgi:diguanylate cyclase (GGDEF)-like protein/PAS domain S-box-containing protein